MLQRISNLASGSSVGGGGGGGVTPVDTTSAEAQRDTFYSSDEDGADDQECFINSGFHHLFKVGQRVFYTDGEGRAHKARIKRVDYDDERHTYFIQLL